MLEKVCEMCEVPPELHHHNVEDYGNTAGAGSVGVLSMRWDEWTDGDDVAVVGVGAGLTWSSFLLRFGGARREVRGLPRSARSFDRRSCSPSPTGGWSRTRPRRFAAKLPLPPMLMVDRIDEIRRERHKGRIVAERDVRLDDWFFQCHFLGDPVQPGCLGVDGVWQLIGFFCAWAGGLGTGRALGCGEVEFAGQIRPHDAVMRYEIDIVRYQELAGVRRRGGRGRRDGRVDGDVIYTIKRAKVGIFRDIDYADYPWPSERSRGGRMER